MPQAMCRRLRRPKARPTSSRSRIPTSCFARIFGPVRFQLELLKPELLLNEANIGSTFVFYGSARIPSPDMADALIEAATNDQQRAIAERLKAKSHYYDIALRACAARQPLRLRRGRQAAFRRLLGRRPVDHGSGQPRRRRRGAGVDRAQHRASARANAQSLRDARPQLPVPLFRASQDAFPAARAGGRGVPRRLRHVRRDVRAFDADPDRQGAAAADPAVRPRILEPGGQFQGDGRGGGDRAARPRPHPLERGRRRGVGFRHPLLRATTRGRCRSRPARPSDAGSRAFSRSPARPR